MQKRPDLIWRHIEGSLVGELYRGDGTIGPSTHARYDVFTVMEGTHYQVFFNLGRVLGLFNSLEGAKLECQHHYWRLIEEAEQKVEIP